MGYAATLKSSFRRHNPDIPVYVFIADRPRPLTDALGDDANVIVIDRTIAPNYERMASIYTIMEYNTSVKPHCIDYLFDALGFDAVCYLDPDILVTSSLVEIFDFLESGDDCVLTPHITAPLSDGFHPGDLAILQAGTYNLGFIGIRNTLPARRFVTWWRNWLETDCLVDLERGVFVDQKFCDLAPAFIERTRILHDPGYNLAYWNLVHRPVEFRGANLFAGGSPVKFIHFSGINKDKPEEFSKHQNRFTVDTIGALKPVFDNYLESLRRNDACGSGHFSRLDYGFGKMNNGVPIIDGMRRCIRRYYTEIPLHKSPFELDATFFKKPTDQLPCEGGSPVNRLLAETYLSRIDCRRAIDAMTRTGRAELKEWGKLAFPADYGLDAEWADCIEADCIEEEPVPKLSSLWWCVKPRSRLPRLNDLGRAQKLLTFYFGSKIMNVAFSQKQMDDFAWHFAYSFEIFPQLWRKRLADLLELDSYIRRRQLFHHWLGERGFTDEGAGVFDKEQAIESRAQSDPIARAALQVVGPTALQRGLAVYGFLHTETGIGEAGRALARAFETTGLPLSCHAIQPAGYENTVEFSTSPSLESNLDTALLAMNADNIQNLDHLMDPAVINGKRKIGLFFWELPVFPDIWSKAFDVLDEIWVSSIFVAESLESATNKTVNVVPLPISMNDLDKNVSRKALGLPLNRLIYLVSFDFNSFPQRKNPLAAVHAFMDAFPEPTGSSPLLVVKCHGIHNREKYGPELRANISSSSNVILIDRVMSRSEMLQLQAAIDVYVSLHRSEGFGLNLAECMAAGKLVIGTRFSGNVDFMNEQNSILIDYDMRQVREGEYVAWQGQWWAEPRHDDAVSALRLAEGSSEMRSRLGQAARQFIKSELSYEEVGLRMADYVGQLWHSGSVKSRSSIRRLRR
jgi:glycosyltransferase involved in cell wall biosynthesis